MNVKVAKIIGSFIFGMIILSSCNDASQENPYAELLSHPPFAGLTDSIRMEPKNDSLYFRRAVLLNSNNYPEPALADFQKAWSLQKTEKYALGIGNLLADSKPDTAIQFLQDALKTLPGSFLLKLTLAHAYTAANKTSEALAITDELLSANPDQVDVLKMKADLLSRTGRDADATNTLERAYQLTPYDIELNYILALRYAENKNPRVLRICDSLIKVDTAGLHAEPYYYKGIYYSNSGDAAKAIALFDEAIRHDYTFLESYIEKGSIYYNQGKYAEAMKVFNLSLNISPDYADNYYWIGRCQEAMGQREEAKLNYQRALGIDKNLTEAAAALKRLQ